MKVIPTFDQYMAPIVDALRALGGSASIQELNDAVIVAMALSDEQFAVLHSPGKGSQTEVAYRMAWARTWLKKAGILTNSARGVWALTKEGQEARIDSAAIVDEVRLSYQRASVDDEALPGEVTAVEDEGPILDAGTDPPVPWTQRLMAKLLAMDPSAFERLCQRILRESGFVEVRVTGKTGDGGIDGIGILRLQRVVSFQVLFQCKRYKDSVGAKEIRDFRGAMVGRSDKGLFITTGTFTSGAKDEAKRDGAPPLDLIDGEQLVTLLKDLELGVRRQMVEHVEVDEAWFDGV